MKTYLKAMKLINELNKYNFKKEIISLIRYSDEDGFIKSNGIRDKFDSRKEKVVLSKIAIGVFSIKLLESIVEKFNCEKVGYFGGASFHRPVYKMRYNNKEFTLFNAGISGAWISGDIEDLNYNGVEKFIILVIVVFLIKI